MLVLAVESSTSSAKALLYDTEQGIINSVQRSYGAEIDDKNGRTDTRGVFEMTMAAGREAAAGHEKEVEAVGLCGTWHGLAVCDGKMQPVTPTFSWNFRGTSEICDAIRKNEEQTDWLYQRTGCMPHNTYPRHVLTFLGEQGYELKDKYFITQGAYNFYRLTGEFIESACTHSGTGILNLEKLCYDEEVLAYLGVNKKQFGTLGTYEDVCPLTEEGAGLLGLRAGIPVVPAHADGAMNQIGNYANRPGIMTMSVGTSAAIRLCVEQPVLPAGHQLWCYYGANRWISGAAVSGACNCIDWFREKVMGGKVSYADLEQGGTHGEDVPVFLPFLFSERCPGWDAGRKGGFVGLEGTHTMADLYKGIQMGVLFNLYQCYETLCAMHQVPQQIIVSGGISNSARWTQMAADIFGMDILVADCSNASSMGTVALALHAAGGLKDINEFQADYDSSVLLKHTKEKEEYYKHQYQRYLKAYGERSI